MFQTLTRCFVDNVMEEPRPIIARCPKCGEVFTASFMRHSTSNDPVFQNFNPAFCPVCGTKIAN